MSHPEAEALFRKACIPFEPEPGWIAEGRKPDFYCRGKHPFWCEVKNLERLEDTRRLGEAFNELSARTGNLELTGQGFAHIHPNFSHRDAKTVVHLLKRALRRLADRDAPDTVVALVPLNPDYREFVRFAISTKMHGTVEFHSCTSPTGTYGSPDGIYAEPYEQRTRLRFSTGAENTFLAGRVVAPSQSFLVAIVAQKHPEKFTLMAAASAGTVKRLRNPERIRNVLNDANDQFKNGLKYKTAPCLLAIFHEGLDVPDDTIIKSALYGDLKFSFPKGNPGGGRLILDKDGAWNPEKNRTTSALLYTRNNAEPLLVHNYWAEHPFPRGLFACREVSAQADGTFHEEDFAGTTTSLRGRWQKLVHILLQLFGR
ncbi:hypothetical protein [Rhodopseudomonas sp. BR0M22]|uniref:hypothetical protein n=1 Tax=Rhodopseudomonas sp. BR0M22 TaxID=2269369 RepID=UPI0013DFEF90|nr:hypothetical protein [Rhodopseudomonas sp. BR0M22]NEW93797.1 hypothetical protein [Rhodopseudomonas sp. BR0M22]